MFWPLSVLVMLSAVAAEPTSSTVPSIALALMKQPPTIDGLIDETEWKCAVRNVGLVSHHTRAVAPREGVFWIGCDGQSLYLALKTEAAPDGRILTRAVPDAQQDVRATLLDDSIELIVDPKRGRSGGDRAYYHLISNSRGALFDWAMDPDNKQNPRQLGWRIPKWQFQQKLADGWWNVEVAIPLAALGASAEDLKNTWGLEVARNWVRPQEQSQWSSEAGDYDHQPSMPQVNWDAAAPVTRVLSLHENWQKPKLAVAVFNPHSTPVSVDVLLSDAWHRDPPQELHRQLSLAPGQEQTVVLEGRDGGPEGLHATTIRVASPDGQRVFYQRRFRWSMHRPADLWTIGEEQKQDVSLQFKYYPYLNKINYRASFESLSLRDRISGAEAGIFHTDDQGKPTGQPIWQQPLAIRNFVSEGICDIPPLADGKYVFAVQVKGGQGVPGEPVLQPFARQVFPWEHNTLGITDEVMPPFTPLEVDGQTVKAVLREHRHGTTGLWDQVVSQEKPLLAGPMTWEVVAPQVAGGGSSVHRAEGQGWRAIAKKPTAVVGEVRWTAGPVKAKVQTDYDYDGMMLVTLTLEPTSVPIERLSLCIPLREAAARYMHAVGDGLRHNYAGFTPAGQGQVWDSSQASKLEIAGTFFPYLWLGDGERGLCWFADTDRDWALDDKTPALDLARQGEALTLRVHFITKAGPLDRPHRIVFGLQATPTKPMPEGWRRWMASKRVEGGRTVSWMGATYYWGGLSYDVYPYQYRFDYFDKLRETRETGQVDQKFIGDWLKMWQEKLGYQKGSQEEKFFQAHVNAGFYSAKSSPWKEGHRLFVYTNPRGVGFHVPEFATFQDEWLRYANFNRRWNPKADVGYDVSPCRSFQDYCLWYYRKMLTCFDGVYWDNTFLSAHFDPVIGEAWTDQQGRIHPTLGLIHLRELTKRTAVMLWQETRHFPESRRPPITLAHMTNTQLVPVNSFLNCTMDWEWKYGMEDFQDRFSPDLTVAETIGRQVGAWPTILAGGHPDSKDPRLDFLQRTRLGVTLVHEIQVFDYSPQLDRDIYRKLYEFGYGTEACRVFNYWQQGHPVQVDGIQAATLAMAKDGQAVIVVTDYGAGGPCRMKLDLASLGLKQDAAATDFETGAAIQRTAAGTYAFAIKKHDFKILRVQ
jgi:hypothetical protein